MRIHLFLLFLLFLPVIISLPVSAGVKSKAVRADKYILAAKGASKWCIVVGEKASLSEKYGVTVNGHPWTSSKQALASSQRLSC